jgi:cytochrome c553
MVDAEPGSRMRHGQALEERDLQSNRFGAVGALCAMLLLSSNAATAQGGNDASSAGASFPAWAYLWAPSATPLVADDGIPRRVPDSSASFSVSQQRDLFFALDWHPADHAPMPDIVAKGRPPSVRACGACHRAEGTGGPENASLAGLSADYMLEQLADYKSGARSSSVPTRRGSALMIESAKALTEQEARSAADYFSSLKPRANIKVIEADRVPKTYVAGMYFAAMASGGSEPIGMRIVEMAIDVEQFERRDPRTPFVAYVPEGSVARGEALAKGAAPKTPAACASCHGDNLQGVGSVPRLAGRSPTYLVRQLYDFQKGVRGGPNAAPMKQVVEGLSEQDMLSLSAYAASLSP